MSGVIRGPRVGYDRNSVGTISVEGDYKDEYGKNLKALVSFRG